MFTAMWIATLWSACCISVVGAIRLPFNCGFESYEYFCGMSHDMDKSDFRWDRDYYGTSTYGTGPSSAFEGRYYMYTEANDADPNDKAYLQTPPIGYSGDVCISFWYNMYVRTSYKGQMGDLIVFTSNQGESCPLVKLVGDQSSTSRWMNYKVQGTISDGDMVVFLGVRGIGIRSDIAVDELTITKGACSSESSTPVCSGTGKEMNLLNTSVIISAAKSSRVTYYRTEIKQSVVTSIEGDPSEWVPTITSGKSNVKERTTIQTMRKLGVNYLARKIVWSNYVAGNIAYGTVNADVKDIFISRRTAHYYTSPQIGGIAVDWVANNVYWTDQIYKWIKMTTLGDDTADYYTVISKNIDKPSGICVDPKHSYLFWADVGKTPKIERTNLRGQARRVIVSKIKTPVALDIDYLSSRLYWVDSGDQKIFSCNFNGTDMNTFHERAFFISTLVGISTYNNYLFAVSNTNKFYMMNISNAADMKSMNMSYENAFDVVVFGEDKQENLTSPCSAMGCEGICVGKSMNSKAECFCPDGKELYHEKYCIDSHYFNSPMYVFTRPTTICVADAFAPDLLDSEFNGTVCLRQKEQRLPSTIFAIGQLYQKKYLYVSTGNDIYMMTMSSSGKPYLLISGAGNVTSLSIDWVANNIYWVDSAGFIKVATTKGKYRTVIITEEGIKGLVVDPTTGYLYYTTNKEIKKAQMDGSSGKVLIRGLFKPGYITLDYKDKRLYWVEVSTTTSKIHSIKTDGSDTKVIVSFKTTSKYYNSRTINIASFQHHIAWSYGNRLSWAFKDPAKNVNITTKSTRYYYSRGPLLLYGEYSQPNTTQNKCGSQKGGCSHACLTVPQGVVCKCDIGFDLDADKKTCKPANIGVADMIITSMAKHQIIVLNSKNKKSAVLPVNKVEQPHSIDVDVSNYYIFWTDDFTKDIKRASFQGFNQVSLKQFPKGYTPKGLAVDTRKKMIFYGIFNRTISSMDYNGKNDKLVVTVDRESPQSITLDMTSQFIYWTNWGMFPGISMASYQGTNRQILVDGANLASPTGVLYDEKDKLLYWCDFKLGRLESIKTDGTGRTLINYDFMAQFSGMTFLGDIIYLTDQRSSSIRKIPKTKGSNFTTVGSPIFSLAGGIVSFDLSKAPKVTPAVITTPTTTAVTPKTTVNKGTLPTKKPGVTPTENNSNTTGTVGKNTGKGQNNNGLGTTAIILIAVFGSLAFIVIVGMVVACGITKSRHAILDSFSNAKSRMSRFSSQSDSDTMSTSSELAAIDKN